MEVEAPGHDQPAGRGGAAGWYFLGVTVVILAAVHTAGVIGDLWISTLVLDYPMHAVFVNERDRAGIYPCVWTDWVVRRKPSQR